MFEYSSIEQYHAQLQDGSTTCVKAVEHYLEQIKNTRHLNAFVEVYAEEALLKAKLLDAQRASGNITGKLHGVVVGLKDVIAYKDHALTASSNILKGFISLYSATAVEKLLAEEAIVIGRCNCDEFAMGSTNENSAYGKVLNARDESRVPGGSSGGSAVAVQAGLCMISLGSDTGGSVRQPADFCGIIGLKPTYGRISRHGLVAYASSFDQIGVFGRTIADIAITYEVIAGSDDFDSTLSLKAIDSWTTLSGDNKKYRIAWFNEALEHPSLDVEISTYIRALLDKLRHDGHEVKPVPFELLDYVVPAYYVLTTAEASSNLSRYDGVKYGYRTNTNDSDITDFYKESRAEGFGTEVKRRIMLGTFVLSSGYYDAYFTKAQKVRKLIREKIELVFKEFDFILLPTSPSIAFKFGEKSDPIAMYLADIYTVMANLTGIPAISLPLFWHNNGLGFGLQVMSTRFNEVHLLHFSNQLMRDYKTNQV